MTPNVSLVTLRPFFIHFLFFISVDLMIKKGGTVVEISIITINIQSYTNYINLVYIIIMHIRRNCINSPCILKHIPSSTGASQSGIEIRPIYWLLCWVNCLQPCLTDLQTCPISTYCITNLLGLRSLPLPSHNVNVPYKNLVNLLSRLMCSL